MREGQDWKRADQGEDRSRLLGREKGHGLEAWESLFALRGQSRDFTNDQEELFGEGRVLST